MIKITLKREPSTDKSTPGKLYLGEKFLCYTLEDVVREDKIQDVTAIPAGTYEVVRTYSPKFDRQMPLLLDVPNFTGIRIHSGNTAEDSSGCILVGKTRVSPDYIGDSRTAYTTLDAMVVNWLRSDKLYIEILPAEPAPV